MKSKIHDYIISEPRDDWLPTPKPDQLSTAYSSDFILVDKSRRPDMFRLANFGGSTTSRFSDELYV